MHGFEQERKVYVAHIDILGMSSILRKSSWDAWMLLGSLAEASELEELPITPGSRMTLCEKFFSDTIIIRTEDDSVGALHTIIARTMELFRCAFRSSVPLRAGIAYGSWFESETETRELFTGDALLRSYKLGESQQVIGIAICDVSRERFLERPFTLSSNVPVLKDYPLPVQGGGRENRAIVHWPIFCEVELRQINPLTEKRLAQYFYAHGSYESLDESAKSKYLNTVKFIQCVANK